jgi:hypothetical protein
MYVVLIVACICVAVLCGILWFYVSNLNKISLDVEILQKANPTDGEIQELLVRKQPTIFADVLYDWYAISEIFDVPLELIVELLGTRPFVELLEMSLAPYALLCSRGWKFQATNITPPADTDKHGFFRLENNHRHLVAQITGTQRFYIASPNQTVFIKPISPVKDLGDGIVRGGFIATIDFFNSPKDSEFNKIQYIEIILREGNLLYIPRGWWYFQIPEESGIVLEAVNESLFS